MASTKKLAGAISARELSSAVDKAVAAAARRVGIEVLSENLVHKWDLIGRVVRDAATAPQFAEDVTAQLKQVGVTADAATLIQKKIIIAGFIERGRIAPASRLL